MQWRRIPICAIIFIALDVVGAQSCWRNTICTGPPQPAFPGPWQTDIYAPPTRTVRPRKILSLNDGRAISRFPAPARLTGNGSALVFDFGIEVGGIIRINYTSSGDGQLGLSFSEAKNWIGEWSDASNGRFKGPDGALHHQLSSTAKGRYIMPDEHLRGGFRYMTLFLETSNKTTINIADIKLEVAFQPTWSYLHAYQGYFHCSDDLLNKIWYAGAYTLQTNAVPTRSGRQVPMLSVGWANNASMGPGNTILVDGAKRDRAVWPGDLGVAVPSAIVSTGDMESVKNALQVIYDYQNPDGSFPEAGPPLLQQNSDTYHMWTLIGTYNYLLYTSDIEFLMHNWDKYQRALNFIFSKVDDTSGLLSVTGTRDWARWHQGGNNSEANMIFYQTMKTAATVYRWTGDGRQSKLWHLRVIALLQAINTHLYDESHGAFRDNATSTTLYPQDANSMAIVFNATYSNRTNSISDRLRDDWTDIGPVAPELPGNISPFITSFELQAHFMVHKTSRALDLIRRTWGWYLTNPNGTESTMIEGYRSDGTFGYRAERGYSNEPSYVSHSHGWSTGPTSALTNYIAGLTITDLAGSHWRIAPQLGDLSFAEAGFTTSLGKYRCAWQRVDASQANQTTFRDFAGYDLQIETPLGTEGEVVLPFLEDGVEPSISVFETSGVEGDRVLWSSDGRSWSSVVSGGKKMFSVRSVFEGRTGQDAPSARIATSTLKKTIRDWGW